MFGKTLKIFINAASVSGPEESGVPAGGAARRPAHAGNHPVQPPAERRGTTGRTGCGVEARPGVHTPPAHTGATPHGRRRPPSELQR